MAKAFAIAFKLGAKMDSTYASVFKKAEEIANKTAKLIKKTGKIPTPKTNEIPQKLPSKNNKHSPIDESLIKKSSKSIERNYNNAFKSIENSASKTISSITKTIAGIGSAVLGGIAVVDAVNTYKDFEQSMANTAAIAGVEKGTETYAKLEKAALDAGKATSKTAQEASDALGFMSLAGWSSEESMQGLMPILRLSEATGAELAGTSDLVTDSMSSLGLKVNDLSRYLDVAAKANNKSNQTATQLLEAYIGVGGVFKNFNTDITESSALLGVLANRGIKGSEAGNKMSATLVNLTKQSGESAEAMKKLGVKAYDSQGNFKGVTKVLEDLNGKTKNLTAQQRDNYFTMIAGKTQLDTLNALMSGLNTTNAEGVSELSALQTELENATGSLDTMAEAVNNTMTGAMARLDSAMDDFKINMVKQLEPAITPIINKIANTIPKITEAIVKTTTNAKNFGKAFVDGFKNMKSDGIVKAFFPMFEQAQTTLPSLFGEKIGNAMIGSLSRTMRKTDNVFEELKPRMPLIEFSAKYFADNFSIGVGKFLNGDSLSTAFSESLKGIQGILHQVFEDETGVVIFDNIKSGIDKVSNIIETVKTGFSEISNAYSESFGAISPEIKTFIDKIMGSFSKIDGDKLSIFSTAFNSIKDIIVEAAPIIADVISIAMDEISSLADGIATAMNGATPIINTAIGVLNSIALAVLKVGNFVTNNWSTIAPIVKGVALAIGTIKMVKLATDIGKATKAFALLKIAKIKDKAETIFLQALYIKDAVIKGTSTAATVAQTVATSAWSVICGIATAVTTGLAGAATFLAGAVAFLTSPIGLVILAIGAVIAIGVLLYKNWDKIKEYASMLGEKISEVFNNIKDYVVSSINSLAERFPVAFGLISAYLGSWIDSIKIVIENVKLVFSNIIDFFKNVFTGNWEAAWENVKNIFSGAFGALEAIAKAPLNAIITLINKAIDGLNGINIKLPDFMGGDSFGLDIPKIPMLAKGSNNTPDTFIAGEKGAELVTNRAGSKVFNALETGSIFKNLSSYENLNLTPNYNELPQSTLSSVTPINTNNSSSVIIQYNPIVNIDGESSDKENLKYLIQDALKKHIQEVKKIVIDTIGSIDDRKVRLSNE